jgi:hypothetical protein
MLMRDPVIQTLISAAFIVLVYGGIGYLIFAAIRGVVRSATRPTDTKVDASREEISALRSEVAELRESMRRIEEGLKRSGPR